MCVCVCVCMYTYNYNIYPDILSGICSDSLFDMGTAGLSNMSSGAPGCLIGP